MGPVEYLLTALHAAPDDGLAWLALSDGLEEAGQPERAELTRLTRQLLALTRTQPERPALEERVQELLRQGVQPCFPTISNSLGMTFGLIPPGVFELGSPPSENERFADETLHEVVFPQAYYLGLTPVTMGQFVAVMGEAPMDIVPGDDLPAHRISHSDALQFCQTLSDQPAELAAGRSYRLPTEAEWEYACRAGTTTAYHHGPALTSKMAAFARATQQGPVVVGSYPPNAFGLYDMHGGVWEWCADWFDEGYYTTAPTIAPPGPESGSVRVIRGGSWMSEVYFCRSACREYAGPETSRPRDGFRVVLVLER